MTVTNYLVVSIQQFITYVVEKKVYQEAVAQL